MLGRQKPSVIDVPQGRLERHAAKEEKPGSCFVGSAIAGDPDMNGAVLYATKYGSTAEYADWIGEATGLPVFNVRSDDVDPDSYDFLILATPVIYYKLLITDWVK